MLYKKHKIRVGVINLIRIELKNDKRDTCDICYGKSLCTIMDICTEIFTPIVIGKYDYICYTKEK